MLYTVDMVCLLNAIRHVRWQISCFEGKFLKHCITIPKLCPILSLRGFLSFDSMEADTYYIQVLSEVMSTAFGCVQSLFIPIGEAFSCWKFLFLSAGSFVLC